MRRPHVPRPAGRPRLGRYLSATAAIAALAITAAGCSSSSSTTPGATGAKVKGGTAVYALPPSTTPNYVFPFTSSAYISIVNTAYFTNLMYRPLYWFGNGSQPQLGRRLDVRA